MKRIVDLMGKPFLAAAAVELLLLVLAVMGLFGKNAIYEYGAEQQEEGVFRNINLPAGTYEVRLRFETDVDAVNLCSVIDTAQGFKRLLTNGEVLYSGRQETGFMMWPM